MNNRNYLWIYLISFAFGLLLIINGDNTKLFDTVVRIIGIGFIIPSVIAGGGHLIYRSRNKENPPSAWMSTVVLLTSVGGLIFGILLAFFPALFVEYLVYTFGVVLIICGIMQVLFMAGFSGNTRSHWAFLVVPFLTLICGVVICILGPEKVKIIVSYLTGAFLLVFSVNGLLGAFLASRRTRAIQKTVQEES